LKFFHDC